MTIDNTKLYYINGNINLSFFFSVKHCTQHLEKEDVVCMSHTNRDLILCRTHESEARTHTHNNLGNTALVLGILCVKYTVHGCTHGVKMMMSIKAS